MLHLLQVDSFFDEQIKALEYYRANLKHEATIQGEVRVKQLESQTEMLSLLLAQLKSSIEFTDQAISDGDDVKLLSMKKQLIQRLSQLNSSQDQLKPCKGDYLKLQVHQAIWDIGKMASLSYIPIDPQKCTVSMVGGEEGVMYQTIAGQTVDFVLTIKDENGSKVTEGGHQVGAGVFVYIEAEAIEEVQNINLAVQDNGDGSYNFSYRPGDVGLATLTVEVEGQNVCGSPFNWQVNPEINPDNEKPAKGQKGKRGKQSTPAFTEGMHSWKLQLVSFSPDRDRFGHLEVGIIAGSTVYHFLYENEGKQQTTKWCWCYNSAKLISTRSDGQQSSITSVQGNDVFTVFLNLETKKLIIYNIRSKQAELFTGVEGEQFFPNVSPQSPMYRNAAYLKWLYEN